MSTRTYDVVLYGASGFTGRQAARYFAQHAPADLRWALAGRDRHKLEALRAELGGVVRSADIRIADSREPTSVDRVVAEARVVLNMAGPFALYGTPVVDACVRLGTHYLDITGETPWIRELITRYHERAARAGTRIVNCCGFDSVPSDLGAFLMARNMNEHMSRPCASVRAYFKVHGSLELNGGTLASVLNMFETKTPAQLDDPFLLDPVPIHPVRQVELSRDLTEPRPDADIGTWIGPFAMAPTNTRVVRRSAALFASWQEPYGPDFVYQEAMQYDAPFARAKAYLATGAQSLFGTLLASPLARDWIAKRWAKPGTGPSPEKMARGWFSSYLVATAPDGTSTTGAMRFSGDAANRATVTFACESALTLASDPDTLPGGPARGGVLTPATALGQPLAERLQHAGLDLEIGLASPRLVAKPRAASPHEFASP